MKPLLLGGKGKDAALATPWQQPVIALETEKEGLGEQGKPIILRKQNKTWQPATRLWVHSAHSFCSLQHLFFLQEKRFEGAIATYQLCS